MRSVTLVIPCFDEAERIDRDAFLAFVDAHPGAKLVFVDDGSRDGTRAVIEGLRDARPGRIDVVLFSENAGKAEAVREGVLHALEGDPDLFGYWDADLATPLDAVPAFVERMEASPELLLVMGARVQLLGRSIQRRAARHYLGRVFATCASWVLRLPVYDTQCGAKLFRNTEVTRSLFLREFLTRWIFDVEILARLGHETARLDLEPVESVVYERPLDQWHDVAGSKVRLVEFPGFGIGLLRIWSHYGRSPKR